MKLHDLRPAAGSRRTRSRVGRGIAAGQGKTAGRGTKGQKSRSGTSIPAWFEGGQTPIHVRVPKLRGFKNRFKVEYAVVNVGQISAYAEAGRFGVELDTPKPARGKAREQPVATVNAEVLASAGLIGGLRKPVKILGQGEVTQKLFVAADAFSASARRKIEGAGGFVQVLAPEESAAQEAEPTPASEPEEVAEPAAPAESEPEQAAEAPTPGTEPEQTAEPEPDQVPEPTQATQPEPGTEHEQSAEPAKKTPRKRATPKKDGGTS